MAHAIPGPPPADWQEAAHQIVADWEVTLWSDAGAKAREYLHRRGLSDDTLRAWQIGFCPADRQYHGLHVDRGITIPWLAQGELWGVNVRTAGETTKLWPRGKPRYMAVPGSRLYLSLFGVDKLAGRPDCFIAEGEFDAMLLWQEIGDLADVLTLARAGRRLAERWRPILASYERFWIVTDADEKGERAAAYWLSLIGDRGRRILPPGDRKDITDAWKAGMGGSDNSTVGQHQSATGQ